MAARGLSKKDRATLSINGVRFNVLMLEKYASDCDDRILMQPNFAFEIQHRKKRINALGKRVLGTRFPIVPNSFVSSFAVNNPSKAFTLTFKRYIISYEYFKKGIALIHVRTRGQINTALQK